MGHARSNPTKAMRLATQNPWLDITPVVAKLLCVVTSKGVTGFSCSAA